MQGLSASYVVVGDGERAPIADGAVVVDDDGLVIAVGAADALRRAHAGASWQHHDAVVMPGLVNAHTHLELSALGGSIPGGRGFSPWASDMLDARAARLPEQDVEAIDAAVGGLLAGGTVAVGEVTNSLAAVDALASAPLLGRVFHEVFGLSKAAAGAAREAAATARARFRDWPANLSYAPGPHTVYTLHPEVVREVLADARALGQGTTVHLAEHAAERAFLRDGGGPFERFLSARGADTSGFAPPGVGPVQHAQALGLLAPDVALVHLTDAHPEGLALVAASGAQVVLCPRSNLHIEVKLPPLTAVLEAGLRPGLGTDSLASCPSLDVLAEARSLAQRFPTVPARTLLAMASSYGAQALGLSHLVGQLVPGRAPGVLAFHHGPGVPADPERFVLAAPDAARELLRRPTTTLREKP